METRAYLKGTRLSPQKAGLVADVVWGISVHAAMDFRFLEIFESSSF